LKPTEAQLESRQQVQDFLARVRPKIVKMVGNIKSDWFGRPDAELQGWIERGSAIEEIRDTRGYLLIMKATHNEIEWARTQLELGTTNDSDMRGYLKALRFVKEFILTVEKNADISATVLAGRPAEIGKDSFVKNARVEG
jgi:hypothetical protein